MAAIVARPPVLMAALLCGLSVLGSHEPVRPAAPRIDLGAVAALDGTELRDALDWTGRPIPPSNDTIEPPAMADARDWPRGMVIRPPSTGDRIFAEVVAHWVSGLLHWVASRPA
jgi:hypothetical protein